MSEETKATPATHKAPLSVKISSFLVNLVYYMFLVGGVLLLIIYLAYAFGLKPENLHVQVPIEISYLTPEQQENLKDIPRPKITAFKGYATMLVHMNDVGYFMSMLTFAIALYVLIGWGIYQLKQIMKSVKAGDVFNRINPKRMRRIAYITIVSGPTGNIGLYMQAKFYSKAITFPGAVSYEFALDKDGTTLLVGLIILVLAHVFEHGVHLQEEQELTI